MKKLLNAVLIFCLSAIARGAEPAKIDWQPWSESIFKKATSEHRFVLLDLEAVWCHWCHVMDEITYRDPKVIELINTRYIAVKVDQDSRPDLSARYEDYGWPATVVFNTDGSEIVKRQGYIPPMPMASMLQAIIDDPSPGPSILPETPIEPTKDAALSPNEREKLQKILRDRYDPKNKGWGTEQKFLSWDIIEYLSARSEPWRRGLWQNGARNPRRAEATDRSGLGRRLSILDRWRLEASALRENHADAGGKSAHLCGGVRALEKSR